MQVKSHPVLLEKIIDMFGSESTTVPPVLSTMAQCAPDAFFQLLNMTKTNVLYKEKIIQQTNHVIRGWTLTHFAAYYGTKRSLDNYIQYMMSSENGSNILISHLDRAVEIFHRKEPGRLKTVKDFLKSRGIIIPE